MDTLSLGGAVVRMVSALAFLIAILFLAVAWMKRNGGSLLPGLRRQSGLSVVDRTTLSAQTAVYVLQFESRKYLVGANTHSITLLTELPRSKKKKGLPDEA